MDFVGLAFVPDSRGDRLAASRYVKRGDSSPQRWVYLRGTSEMAMQVLRLLGNGRQVPVPNEQMFQWTHWFHFPGEAPYAVHEMLGVLEDVLTLTRRRDSALDVAIALDFYKSPVENVPPLNWPNTPTGEFVNRAKYHGDTASAWQLVDKMAEIIELHPVYRAAATVISVPGHNADGTSFGEKMAKHVATKVNKQFLHTECPTGARAPAKEVPDEREQATYRLPRSVTGDVIVIDDVYWTGKSMSDVATAARLAGAEAVYGLAAARNMRRGA